LHLKKKYVDIKNVVFDTKTFLEGDTLHVSKEELSEAAKDYRIKEFEFELAFPGENTRISRVYDVIEPMYKPNGSTFPGIADKMGRVGFGDTIVLRGLGVTEVVDAELPYYMNIDMSGPITEMTMILPEIIHLCMIPKIADDIPKNEFLDALSIASKKIAKFVAEKCADAEPNEVEEFYLKEDGLEGLPKVCYIDLIFCHAPLTDTIYYGKDCLPIAPTIIHPNEILDGALVNRDFYQVLNADPTIYYQHHPVVLELMQRHGKDINFTGVVLSSIHHDVVEKERNAMLVAGLAKNVLKSDGAVITKEGGGHPQIDVALCCDFCEELGIKTAILLHETLSSKNPTSELVLFTTPNADAMVTSGCMTDYVLPRVERIIGPDWAKDRAGIKVFSLYEEQLVDLRGYLRGFLSQIGKTNFTSLKY